MMPRQCASWLARCERMAAVSCALENAERKHNDDVASTTTKTAMPRHMCTWRVVRAYFMHKVCAYGRHHHHAHQQSSSSSTSSFERNYHRSHCGAFALLSAQRTDFAMKQIRHNNTSKWSSDLITESDVGDAAALWKLETESTSSSLLHRFLPQM